ncbi:MAG: PLP-dependent aminotransferase family protein [Steroidobacteraceae bacterium]
MQAEELARHLGPWSAGKGPLQRKLVRSLAQAVRRGLLNPGVRLPSERTLARALRLSRTTVVAAYDSLRDNGWLESRSGSGTWVSAKSASVAAARSAAQAGSLADSPLLGLMERRDETDMVDFALGSPLPLHDLPGDPFTLPHDEYAALVRDRLYYPLGITALREAVARYYRERALPSVPEQILITNGAQQALALTVALYVQRGDVVLVEDPTYFGMLDILRVAGARTVSLPVGGDGVEPALLRDRITATAARLVYLTPTFQNPTGTVMPPAARQEICQIASALGVPVLEDEVLAELAIDGRTPPPIASHAGGAPILTVGSLSKLVWPGLRVGWVRAEEPVIERLARLKSSFELGSATLTQAIAVRVLACVEQARRRRRSELKLKRDAVAAMLREQLPDWSFRIPAGGAFLWVELPRGDAREYAQLALRHGVRILAGPTMSPADGCTRWMRLPFLAPVPTLTVGVRRLATAWREFCAGEKRAATRVGLV